MDHQVTILMAILGIQCIFEILELIALVALIIIISSKRPINTSNTNTVTSVSSKAPQPSSLEQEELARQRKKFNDEMEAFQELLNYNAEVAYGMKSNDES